MTWLQLGSGRAYPFDAPTSIDVETIARSLARQPRFNGHTRQAYSVAQHSVLVSRLVPSWLAPHGLLHDAAEAVIGDLVSPLKRELDARSGGYITALEADILAAILRGFGLEPLDDAEARLVKDADELAMCAEVRDLMKPGERPLELPHGFLAVEHIGRIRRAWGADEAEERFLERWREVRQ